MSMLLRVPSPAQVGWVLSLYPDAREAGGCFVSSRPRPCPRLRGEAGANPVRSRVEGDRRARTSARRYCAANGLNRLGTLTYAVGCHDPRELRVHAGEFFRRLRAGLGGQPLPYLWVGEWHPGGHGLHLHFAVGRYVKRGLIAQAWGRGHVSIKLLGDLGSGRRGVLEEARHAAGYLSKYVTKAGSPGSGLHRYELAQGFQPRRVTLRGRSEAHVLDQASEILGARPTFLWRSSEAEEWEGPPALSARWA